MWFQNARAKDKKKRTGRITDDDTMTSRNESDTPTAEECTLCGVQYNENCTIQDHIFSSDHINKVKLLVKSCETNLSNDCDGSSNDNVSSTSTPPTSDTMGFYNQIILQNHVINQMGIQAPGRSFSSSDINSSLVNSKYIENISRNITSSASSTSSGPSSIISNVNEQAVDKNEDHVDPPNICSPAIENNLVLQINTENSSPNKTNNELLHQIYNYNHMSGELIK